MGASLGAQSAPEQRRVKWTTCCRAIGRVLVSACRSSLHAWMTAIVEATRARHLPLVSSRGTTCMLRERLELRVLLAVSGGVACSTRAASCWSLSSAAPMTFWILSMSSQHRASMSQRCRSSQGCLYVCTNLPAAKPKSSRNVPSRPIVHVCGVRWYKG